MLIVSEFTLTLDPRDIARAKAEGGLTVELPAATQKVIVKVTGNGEQEAGR